MAKENYTIIKICSLKYFGELCLFLSFVCIGLSFFGGNTSHFFDETSQETTLFLLDISRSMNTPDMGGNTRLDTAKTHMFHLIENNPGGEYGLNIFAGESRRIIPFTRNTEIFATLLSGITSENIDIQGTDISAALDLALESFPLESIKTLVVYTDGHDEEILVASYIGEKIRAEDIQIIFVGVGETTASPIPGVLYRGQQVYSRLESGELKKLARRLGGTYKNIDENTILDFRHYTNRFSFFLSLAMIFWIIFCIFFLRTHYG